MGSGDVGGGDVGSGDVGGGHVGKADMNVVDVRALICEVQQRAGGVSLEQIETAIAVSEELQAGADELVGHFVTQARRDGCSWTDIGARLGVSKQAARQKFAAPATRPHDGHASPPRRRRRRGKALDHHCSFCGKGQDSDVEMVAGPGVWICAECVALAGEILAERAGARH